MDELDIYGDLDELHEQEEKKSKELLALEQKCSGYEKTIESLRAEITALKKDIERLKTNCQIILDTALAETTRKDKQINELRRQIDDICFRRKQPAFVPAAENRNTLYISHVPLSRSLTHFKTNVPHDNAVGSVYSTAGGTSTSFNFAKPHDSYVNDSSHVSRNQKRRGSPIDGDGKYHGRQHHDNSAQKRTRSEESSHSSLNRTKPHSKERHDQYRDREREMNSTHGDGYKTSKNSQVEIKTSSRDPRNKEKVSLNEGYKEDKGAKCLKNIKDFDFSQYRHVPRSDKATPTKQQKDPIKISCTVDVNSPVDSKLSSRDLRHKINKEKVKGSSPERYGEQKQSDKQTERLADKEAKCTNKIEDCGVRQSVSKNDKAASANLLKVQMKISGINVLNLPVDSNTTSDKGLQPEINEVRKESSNKQTERSEDRAAKCTNKKKECNIPQSVPNTDTAAPTRALKDLTKVGDVVDVRSPVDGNSSTRDACSVDEEKAKQRSKCTNKIKDCDVPQSVPKNGRGAPINPLKEPMKAISLVDVHSPIDSKTSSQDVWNKEKDKGSPPERSEKHKEPDKQAERSADVGAKSTNKIKDFDVPQSELKNDKGAPINALKDLMKAIGLVDVHSPVDSDTSTGDAWNSIDKEKDKGSSAERNEEQKQSDKQTQRSADEGAKCLKKIKDCDVRQSVSKNEKATPTNPLMDLMKTSDTVDVHSPLDSNTSSQDVWSKEKDKGSSPERNEGQKQSDEQTQRSADKGAKCMNKIKECDVAQSAPKNDKGAPINPLKDLIKAIGLVDVHSPLIARDAWHKEKGKGSSPERNEGEKVNDKQNDRLFDEGMQKITECGASQCEPENDKTTLTKPLKDIMMPNQFDVVMDFIPGLGDLLIHDKSKEFLVTNTATEESLNLAEIIEIQPNNFDGDCAESSAIINNDNQSEMIEPQSEIIEPQSEGAKRFIQEYGNYMKTDEDKSAANVTTRQTIEVKCQDMCTDHLDNEPIDIFDINAVALERTEEASTVVRNNDLVIGIVERTEEKREKKTNLNRIVMELETLPATLLQHEEKNVAEVDETINIIKSSRARSEDIVEILEDKLLKISNGEGNEEHLTKVVKSLIDIASEETKRTVQTIENFSKLIKGVRELPVKDVKSVADTKSQAIEESNRDICNNLTKNMEQKSEIFEETLKVKALTEVSTVKITAESSEEAIVLAENKKTERKIKSILNKKERNADLNLHRQKKRSVEYSVRLEEHSKKAPEKNKGKEIPKDICSTRLNYVNTEVVKKSHSIEGKEKKQPGSKTENVIMDSLRRAEIMWNYKIPKLSAKSKGNTEVDNKDVKILNKENNNVLIKTLSANIENAPIENTTNGEATVAGKEELPPLRDVNKTESTENAANFSIEKSKHLAEQDKVKALKRRTSISNEKDSYESRPKFEKPKCSRRSSREVESKSLKSLLGLVSVHEDEKYSKQSQSLVQLDSENVASHPINDTRVVNNPDSVVQTCEPLTGDMPVEPCGDQLKQKKRKLHKRKLHVVDSDDRPNLICSPPSKTLRTTSIPIEYSAPPILNDDAEMMRCKLDLVNKVDKLPAEFIRDDVKKDTNQSVEQQLSGSENPVSRRIHECREGSDIASVVQTNEQLTEKIPGKLSDDQPKRQKRKLFIENLDDKNERICVPTQETSKAAPTMLTSIEYFAHPHLNEETKTVKNDTCVVNNDNQLPPELNILNFDSKCSSQLQQNAKGSLENTAYRNDQFTLEKARDPSDGQSNRENCKMDIDDSVVKPKMICSSPEETSKEATTLIEYSVSSHVNQETETEGYSMQSLNHQHTKGGTENFASQLINDSLEENNSGAVVQICEQLTEEIARESRDDQPNQQPCKVNINELNDKHILISTLSQETTKTVPTTPTPFESSIPFNELDRKIMPSPANSSQEAKFSEIDLRLQTMFESPCRVDPLPALQALPSPPRTGKQIADIHAFDISDTLISDSEKKEVTCSSTPNLTIDETNSSLECSSSMNDSNTSLNTKCMSLGTSLYRFEKVSDDVTNLFITRKRRRKAKPVEKNSDN